MVTETVGTIRNLNVDMALFAFSIMHKKEPSLGTVGFLTFNLS